MCARAAGVCVRAVGVLSAGDGSRLVLAGIGIRYLQDPLRHRPTSPVATLASRHRMTTFRIARSLRATDFAAASRDNDGSSSLQAVQAWAIAAASSRADLAVARPPPHHHLYHALSSLPAAGSRQQSALPVVASALIVLSSACRACLEHLSAALAQEQEEQVAAVQAHLRSCIFWCAHGLQAVQVGGPTGRAPACCAARAR
jgi:hypothetical protein